MHFIAGFCVCCMPKAALKIWQQFATNDRLLISAVLSQKNGQSVPTSDQTTSNKQFKD